jgi:hypothetical protein
MSRLQTHTDQSLAKTATASAGPAALVLVSDNKPAVPAGTSVAVINPDTVARIRALDAEATALKNDADRKYAERDQIRKDAACLIVELLEAGASQRAVADATGTSRGHISFASTAWFLLQDETLGLTSFNEAYKLAQRPATRAAIEAARNPDAIEAPAADGTGIADAGAGATTSTPASTTEDRPFPPWHKQVQTVSEMVPGMIAQADLRQARALDRTLRRLVSELAARIKYLEGAPGHA